MNNLITTMFKLKKKQTEKGGVGAREITQQ